MLNLDNPFVVSSPRQRALVTAELAGLTVDEVSPLLAEWDYGDYEGLTTQEIRETVPDWLVWTHGCPGGETVQQVSDRADQAIAYALEHMESRDVLFVGHGHFSRAVITRWVELPVSEGIRFAMVAASIAVCGFEHGVRQLSALGTDRSSATRPCPRDPRTDLRARHRRQRRGRRRCAHRVPRAGRRTGRAGVAQRPDHPGRLAV